MLQTSICIQDFCKSKAATKESTLKMYPRLLQIEGCDQIEYFDDEHIENRIDLKKVHGLKSLQVLNYFMRSLSYRASRHGCT